MLFVTSSQRQRLKQSAPPLAPLGRITVWLDQSAPTHGTFAHALEWALLLRLPLHAVVPASATGALAACAATCEREGIAWSQSIEQYDKCSIMYASQPMENDFCVMGGALARWLRRQWLRTAFGPSQAGPLLCPPAWGSLRRVLVLNDNAMASPHYLDNAAAICHGAGYAASVLTLARSEQRARCLQDFAISAFAGRRVAADFHTAVGISCHRAAAMVASWRRCSHIIVEKTRPSVLGRWLSMDNRNDIWGLVDRFAILPVPSGPSPFVERMLTATGGKSISR